MNKKIVKKRMFELFSGKRVKYKTAVDFIRRNFIESDPYVFGGMIRDIALLGGSKNFKSDIDIVCCKSFDIKKILREDCCEVEKNNFGGYRVLLHKKYLIDIWEIDKTWAFEYGGFDFSGVSSLLETTQTNFEAILYDVKNNNLIFNEGYFDDLSHRYLKLINKDNPNKYKMASKILKSIIKNKVLLCDQSVAEFICKVVYEKGDYWLFDNYIEGMIGRKKYYEIIKRIVDFEGELIPVDMVGLFSDPKQKSLL